MQVAREYLAWVRREHGFAGEALFGLADGEVIDRLRHLVAARKLPVWRQPNGVALYPLVEPERLVLLISRPGLGRDWIGANELELAHAARVEWAQATGGKA